MIWRFSVRLILITLDIIDYRANTLANALPLFRCTVDEHMDAVYSAMACPKCNAR